MISCLVLAAGESKRFPGNKLLYEIKPNVSIIEYLLRSIIASNIDQTIVVLGHEAEIIKKRIEYLLSNSVSTIFNNDYKEGGMSSSIRIGIDPLLDNEAILVTPGDIPLIPSNTFNFILDYFNLHRPNIIIPTYNNYKGHPILISSKLFQETRNISEEKHGLKEIVDLHWNEIVFLSTNVKGILRDIDSIDDIVRLKKVLKNQK
ncbi:MAG: NTP transferase domain-containing protein [Candidatus Hodarchaeota archaeon]